MEVELAEEPVADGPPPPMPVHYWDVPQPEGSDRLPTGIAEVDRILGDTEGNLGFVPGSVILVGGEAGSGKSTLLAAISLNLGSLGKIRGILYVSGEESDTDVAKRLRRLAGEPDAQVFLLVTQDADEVLAAVALYRPAIVVLDSVQRMRVASLPGRAGGVSQVAEVAERLCTAAKAKHGSFTLFLVSQVTKEGEIAGPHSLEHLVDVVLWFTGDRGGIRILNVLKNRFGADGEMAMFRMTKNGLEGIDDPAEVLLEGRAKDAVGSVVTVTLRGTRYLPLEIQALTTPAGGNVAKRTGRGVEEKQLVQLAAVLSHREGVDVAEADVYVSVVGGLAISEPAAHLAMAVAITSSDLDVRVPDAVVFGEVGLAGEVRAVGSCTARLEAALRMGFKRALIPAINRTRDEMPEGMKVQGIAHVRDLAKWLTGGK